MQDETIAIVAAVAIGAVVLAKPLQRTGDAIAGGAETLLGNSSSPGWAVSPSGEAIPDAGIISWLNPATYYNIGYSAGEDLGTWVRGWF